MSGLLHEDVASVWWKRGIAPYSSEIYEFGNLLKTKDPHGVSLTFRGIVGRLTG